MVLTSGPSSDHWPELPYAAWKDTCQTLQLWTQIVGKIRLARTPWLNHSWHVHALRHRARAHHVADPRRRAHVPDRFRFRRPCAVAAHQRRPLPPGRAQADVGRGFLRRRAARAGGARHRRSRSTASRTKSRMRSRSPTTACMHPTIRDYANRFWRILSASNEVFAQFRTGFLGKASPVHFFWGSFDLAVTRFSGRTAPRHPGGVPNLPDDVAQEAYSHEVSSAGFWPGGGAIDYPAYYSYAYPAPRGLRVGAGAAGAGILFQGARRVHPAVRRGAHGGRSARSLAGLPAIDLRRGRRPRTLGPRGARMRDRRGEGGAAILAAIPDCAPLHPGYADNVSTRE